MIKIKFTCNWDSDANINKRVVSNFVTTENYDPNILITNDNDYDFLFCFNRIKDDHIIPVENIFTFIMEPSWSSNWDRNCFNKSNKVFTHDKTLFGFHENIVEIPSTMFYHMDYKTHTIDSLLKNKKFDKPKKMSMIVSYTPNSEQFNYGLRTELALKLLDYNFDIDIFGNGWPSSHKNIKGSINDKYDALIDYEFSIGIENSNEKNYVTEKFFDISLCNGHPIYCGAPNVDEIYDNFTSINLNNIPLCLDTISDVLKDKSLYDSHKITKNKFKYFEKYNIYNIVKNIVLQ